MAQISLPKVLDELELMSGPTEPPDVTDPFEMILWENVVYLSDNNTRRKALSKHCEIRVGTRPEDILAASHEVLLEIASSGMLPELRVDKMCIAAELVVDAF